MDLISFDGYDFAANGWTVDVPFGPEEFAVDGSYVAGGPSMPRFAGLSYNTRVIPVEVWLNTGTAAAEAKLNDLRRALRFDLATERDLIVQAADGTQLVLPARPRQLVRSPNDQNVGLVYLMLFEASENHWRNVVAKVATIDGPASPGGTVSIARAIGGTVRARPVITLKPLDGKTSNQIFVATYEVTEPNGRALTSVPTTITIDHAALVSGGKSTAGGTDIKVSVDGTEVVRSITGANTTSMRVTFPVTLTASGTATVQISYAPSGQTYALTGYAQDFLPPYLITERSANALTTYPYMLTINHAAVVTAGRSIAAGTDIRVWVNGVEVSRTVASANTAATKVSFPITLSASGAAVVVVTFAASGYSYTGGAYTNGSMDVSASSTTAWVYTTPAIDGSSIPGRTSALLTHVVEASNPTGYDVAAATVGADPGLKARAASGASGLAQNGNYVKIGAGGVPLVSLAAKVTYRSGEVGASNRSRAILASRVGAGAYSAHLNLSGVDVETTQAYATTTLTSGATDVIFGSEMIAPGGLAASNYAIFSGNGSSELTLTLDSTKVPLTASLTSPTNTGGTESFGYTFAGTLVDELGHTLTLTGPTIQDGQALVIDADQRTAYLIDSSGDLISGTAAAARAAISLAGSDTDWLAMEPEDETTFVWTEADMDTNGMRLSLSVYDRWL